VSRWSLGGWEGEFFLEWKGEARGLTMDIRRLLV
jgi:hypothetical protein